MKRSSLLFLFFFLVACTQVAPPAQEVTGDLEPLATDPRWSDPTTWPSGRLPQAGENVEIPAGKRVVLDVNTPNLAGLTINGTLLFDRKDVNLSATWIMVHGRLQIGSNTAPFLQRATLTLRGSNASQDIMGMGTKFLGAMGSGVIALYGAPVKSWSKLSTTASAGSNSLTVLDAKGWRVGDSIVITSTDYWDWDPSSKGRNEIRKITAISGNTLTLDSALKYKHWGQLQTYAGFSVDERASVGLLTRTVKIQGDSTSTNGFGGHLMMMQGTRLYLNNVELYRMGQSGRNGRYPVHWHLTGNSTGQFIRNSAIWESNNRCVTLHNADNIKVENNVCYNFMGHGYFLEDGAETGNTFAGNLGVWGRQPADSVRLLESDKEPSVFWITNPANTFRNNVAAGTEGRGYWLAFSDRTKGLSSGEPNRPRFTPLTLFDKNAAHSSRGDGFHIGPDPDYTGPNDDPNTGTRYAPRQNPNDLTSPKVDIPINNFAAFKHHFAAIWYEADRVRLNNLMLANNSLGLDGANNSWFEDPSDKKANIIGGVIIGSTANDDLNHRHSWLTGISLYDGRVFVRDTTFINFASSRNPNAKALSLDQNDQLAILDQPLVENVKFINAVRTLYDDPATEPHGSDYTQVHLDRDGSWTGQANTTIVGEMYPYVLTPNCTRRAEWRAYICPDQYVQIGISTNNEEMDLGDVRLTGKTYRVTRDDGVSHDTPDNNTALIPGRKYVYSNVPAERVSARLRIEARLEPNETVTLTFPYPGGNFTGYTENFDLLPASSKAQVDAGNGTLYFYDAARKEIYLKLVGRPNPNYYNYTTYMLYPR
jgi:hypothetical protein